MFLLRHLDTYILRYSLTRNPAFKSDQSFNAEDAKDAEEDLNLGESAVTTKAMGFYHPLVTHYMNVTHWRH